MPSFICKTCGSAASYYGADGRAIICAVCETVLGAIVPTNAAELRYLASWDDPAERAERMKEERRRRGRV